MLFSHSSDMKKVSRGHDRWSDGWSDGHPLSISGSEGGLKVGEHGSRNRVLDLDDGSSTVNDLNNSFHQPHAVEGKPLSAGGSGAAADACVFIGRLIGGNNLSWNPTSFFTL